MKEYTYNEFKELIDDTVISETGDPYYYKASNDAFTLYIDTHLGEHVFSEGSESFIAYDEDGREMDIDDVAGMIMEKGGLGE